MARPILHPRFSTAFAHVMQGSFTIWRNPPKEAGKTGAPEQVDVIAQATIEPVVGNKSTLVPEAMLAGVRSPHLLIAATALDLRAADEVRDGSIIYKVHHPGIIANGVTVAVLSKPE